MIITVKPRFTAVFGVLLYYDHDVTLKTANFHSKVENFIWDYMRLHEVIPNLEHVIDIINYYKVT